MTTNQQNALLQSFQSQCDRIGRANPNDKKYRSQITKFVIANPRVCLAVDCVVKPEQVTKMIPVAGILRLAQALNFIVTSSTIGGSEKSTGAFADSTGYLVAAVALSNQEFVSYSDMQYLMTRKGDSDSTHIKGVSQSRLHALLKTIKQGTAGTRVSSAVGKNGFMVELGIVEKETRGGAEGFKIINANHPVILGYCAALGKVSDGDFDMLIEKLNTKNA